MQQNHYLQKNFYLSAFLYVNNCTLLKHERIGNSTTFTFIDSEELRNLVNGYYSNTASVNPIKYAEAIRTLKSMIHSNRSESILTSISENLNNEFNNKYGERK
jgi:hypothetical protein